MRDTGYEGGGRRWAPWWRKTAADFPNEGYAKRYFGRRTQEEAWREGGSEGIRKWRAMEVDRAAASEIGDTQVSRGPGGDKTQDWYAGTELGDSQVGGLSRAETRREVSVEREGVRLSLGGKSKCGKGGQIGWE